MSSSPLIYWFSGIQFGQVPVVPVGHFGTINVGGRCKVGDRGNTGWVEGSTGSFTQFGGVPVVPGGQRQLGGVPTEPAGQRGCSIGMHSGNTPLVPGGRSA